MTKRRMRAPERRRQLIETAAEVFARHGYRGTTTAVLAKAAGITEPVLYQHFSNKLDLFITLLDEVGNEVIMQWKNLLDKADDPHDRLEILLRGNPATHERGKGIYRVIFHAMTEVENDKDIVKALKVHISKLQKFVRNELNELQEDGVVRDDISPAALTAFLIDIAIGYGILMPLKVTSHSSPAGKTKLQQILIDFLSID